MPVPYLIDQASRIIRTRCVGNVTFDEVMNHFRILADDPACLNYLNVLLDLTEMTSLPESKQLRSVSDQIGSVREAVQFGACAIVAPNDVLFGLTRMFSVFAENRFRVIQVFRKLDEAEVWLVGQLSPATAPDAARPGVN